MIKFLSKCNEQNQNNTCNILTQSTTQSNKLHNTINPNNVKLLFDDNAGVDFLTLCAVKRSEEEVSSKTVHKMDTTYVPAPKPIKDLFNFILPDIEVIDCLSSFTRVKDISLAEDKRCEDDLSMQCKNNENETIHNNNDCIDINDNNFWCTIQNVKNIDDNEIRFEDILDESSDSDKTTISHLDQQVRDIEINSINVEASVSNTKDNDKVTDIGIEVPNNTTDLETSLFENILNESFSSIEDNSENEEIPRQNIISSNSPNVFVNIENINITSENIVNTFDKDNVTKSNSNLSLFKVPAQPNQMNIRSFTDEIQDLNFDSDDDINEFVRHKSSRNKSIHNSKMDESLLSITQAIDAIAGMKKNSKISPKPSICNEESIDESAGWISVNTKNETKIETRNTSPKIENKLSNLCNSTPKSHTVKQKFDFLDDSDEDFMFTEDNVKKFNELESCYFRDTSKNYEDKNSCLPSTSRNSESKSDYFDINMSKHSESKSYYDNSSTNMKPHTSTHTSTSINNKRAVLSLKRNKIQHPDKIDLSLFEAPKYTNNKKDKNILVSSSPKQMFPSNKTIEQKIKRGRKHRNNVKNEFIDDEAEVDSDASSDETIIIDEDDLADFVSYTQHQDSDDMHAHYLQTIKSPIKRPGAFHFRKPPSPNLDRELYSQPLSQVQDSYLYVRKLFDLSQAFCLNRHV